MGSLAFFYRRGTLSGEIRRQVAERLGAKVNPATIEPDDVCIGVKMGPGSIARDKRIDPAMMGDYYYDIIDQSTSLRWLSHWPMLKVIVASKSSEAYMRGRFQNPLTVIPQHHCNVERQVRPTRPIKVVAYIGLMTGLPPWYDQVNTAVKKMGLEMRYLHTFKTRQDVVNAYLQTDIQFQWRDGMPEPLQHLKNPLKVINGLSFGIPTVSSKEPPYVVECDGRFVGADTIDEAMDAIHGLSAEYERYAVMGPAFAEPYHLDHIAPQFQRLCDA